MPAQAAAAGGDPVSAVAGAIGDIAQTFKAGLDIIRGRDMDFSARNAYQAQTEYLWSNTNSQRLSTVTAGSKTRLITTITALLFLLIISLTIIHKHK